ncbi:MAG: phosphate ABC transporter permease PstA [Actinomycetota bacterium]|nr:phosphate ABC transporter permease PstA [Actinomycetota bacterium]
MEASRFSLAPSPRTRRRKAVNRLMEAISTLASLAAIAVLVLVVASIAQRGASAINLDFLTKAPAGFGEAGGGIAPAIAGSLLIVILATAMALPVGVLVAIYLSEFAPRRVAEVVRIALDVLNGLPTIVFGIFVFSLVVLAHGQSAFAGALALGILMLPLIARATQEVLRLVPSSLREAGLALGASRWRTVLGVILPTAFGGILTGTTLAIARAAGETAPLLFTSSIAAEQVIWKPTEAVQTIPVTIFQLSDSPDPADHARAWAAALVLLAFVLVTSLTARALLARSRRKLGL